MPEEYTKASWDRCRVHDLLRSYVAMMRGRVARGYGWLLMGPPGSGKSSTAALLAREALMLDLSVTWTYVPDLLDKLREMNTRQQIVRLQTTPDLLVWDDFGVTDLSPWEIGQLDRIVERRYSNRKAMIVTTNLTAKQLGNAEQYARMVDRFRSMCKGAVISGGSMRVPWQDEEE